MAYKTYQEQIFEHLNFLQTNGLEISELSIGGGFLRCRASGLIHGRGEFAYKTKSSILENGLYGLSTWCRGASGEKVTFHTYGLAPDETCILTLPVQQLQQMDDTTSYEAAARKAFGFWKYSSETGFSDYLKRKEVGYHGIRFRSTEEYGNSAIVPMRDVEGKLWSYQILNADGSKRFPKDARVNGLFHALKPITESPIIGIAESYATAATCMENTGIVCICCFGCDNIKCVLSDLLGKYPESSFIIFADNDRHLSTNVGVVKAEDAQKLCEERVALAVPDFGRLEPSQELTDWNDLIRLAGDDGRGQLLKSAKTPFPR